ncbi:Hypothetical predicted protein [Octopus vulgaris]|uniref:Uncharacterized protein n=1 Tax=Octopus vulgaris TaxID=6645 RepID=A0AA36FK91_OCTVU|nr:Hypothetical predicted protein [Octopus vulgaris]
MVRLGSGKPGGCTRLQSDLAVFLQLDALPVTKPDPLSSYHCLGSVFHASTGWTVRPGSGRAEGCTSLQSDLAVFLQLDALPNANHSVSVVGAFYVPPAQGPGECHLYLF